MKVKYTKELMEEAVKNSFSYADVCRKIGLSPRGSNYKTIKTKIALYNLDISHFTGQRWNAGKSFSKETSHHSLQDIMQEGVIYSSNSLKKRLIKEEIKKNECELCFISGEEVPLELHHINGNHNDNRLENLQILCPNCHSKTPNFRNRGNTKNSEAHGLKGITKEDHIAICENCGKEFYSDRVDKLRRFCCRECYLEFCKNHKEKLEKNKSIDKENLIELTNKYSNITQIAEELGISRPTVKKYLMNYGLYEDFKMKYDFHAKIIEQYDINLNFIKEWPSITDAASTLGINGSHISDCAKHNRRSAGGYIWKYKD